MTFPHPYRSAELLLLYGRHTKLVLAPCEKRHLLWSWASWLYGQFGDAFSTRMEVGPVAAELLKWMYTWQSRMSDYHCYDIQSILQVVPYAQDAAALLLLPLATGQTNDCVTPSLAGSYTFLVSVTVFSAWLSPYHLHKTLGLGQRCTHCGSCTC